MFRIKDTSKLAEMGFSKNDYTGDHEIMRVIKGNKKRLFIIYRGSDYLRYSKTGYVVEEQLKLIYEWSKKDYIYIDET